MNSLPKPTGNRILVVDDLPANVQLLVRMLAVRGHRPESVNSGAEALAAARLNPPDLILLDINMPGMDGFEVCKQLKADAQLRDIPVLFVSAVHESVDKVKAFGLGAVDYVTKPFQLEEVFARVETHLQLRQLRQQLATHNRQLEQVVAERTQELETAYRDVQELSRIQGEFLSMILHEMRTPAHGLLGLIQLLLLLCPASSRRTRYSEMFAQTQGRLIGLFEDVSLIGQVDAYARERTLTCSCADVFAQVLAELPGVLVSLVGVELLRTGETDGSLALCVRALKTTMQLAQVFSLDKQVLRLDARMEGPYLCLTLELDSLSLSDAQAHGFFAIATTVRAASEAESLGLAPAVAHHILRGLGGDLTLVKETGNRGSLQARLKRRVGAQAASGATL